MDNTVKYQLVAESINLQEGKIGDFFRKASNKVGEWFGKKQPPKKKTIGDRIKGVFSKAGEKVEKAKSAAEGAKKVANILDKFNRATKFAGKVTGYSDLRKGYKNNPDFGRGVAKAAATAGVAAGIGYGLHKRKKAKREKERQEIINDLKSQMK